MQCRIRRPCTTTRGCGACGEACELLGDICSGGLPEDGCEELGGIGGNVQRGRSGVRRGIYRLPRCRGVRACMYSIQLQDHFRPRSFGILMASLTSLGRIFGIPLALHLLQIHGAGTAMPTLTSTLPTPFGPPNWQSHTFSTPKTRITAHRSHPQIPAA